MRQSLFFIAFLALVFACTHKDKKAKQNVVITMPAGFKVSVYADSLGSARHIVTAANGDLFVKLSDAKSLGGIVWLKDTNTDGKADVIKGFGNYGGSGIAINDSFLYTTSDDDVFAYKMNNGVPDTASMQKIIEKLVNKGQHSAKTIAIDKAGNIYVNIGAPSNACQEEDRTAGSKGMNPCPILDSAGGIWQFKTNKINQHYADGIRYATGIRNMVALTWNDEVNELYGLQHGRDDLDKMFPKDFTEDQRVNLPAEEMFLVKQGNDFGWPYCYYDPFLKNKMQAPEYGGNGKTTTGCEDKQKPIYAFPAHWAPNGVVFYTGNKFPEKYRNGAFIAFHGSWNRAPQKQGGYCVAFLPFKDGKPSGEYEIFADGFAGEEKSPGESVYRPCGITQGPDGSLYVSDDKVGRIWKITYEAK